MCRAMGDKDILFLRNHGIIVSGPTVAQAYDDLYYLERAAMVQVLAMQTGRPLHTSSTRRWPCTRPPDRQARPSSLSCISSR